MLSAGKLNNRISIYAKIKTKTTSGAMVEKLQFTRKCWASIVKSANSASTQNDQLLTIGGYELKVRYALKKSLSNNDWIEINDRWLKITDIDDTDPKRSKLTITAEHDNKHPPEITE